MKYIAFFCEILSGQNIDDMSVSEMIIRLKNCLTTREHKILSHRLPGFSPEDTYSRFPNIYFLYCSSKKRPPPPAPIDPNDASVLPKLRAATALTTVSPDAEKAADETAKD